METALQGMGDEYYLPPFKYLGIGSDILTVSVFYYFFHERHVVWCTPSTSLVEGAYNGIFSVIPWIRSNAE